MKVLITWIVLALVAVTGITYGVHRIQQAAVAKDHAETMVKTVLADNKRLNSMVDLIRKSAQRDSAKADSAEKRARESQARSDQTSADIAAVDSAAAELDNPDNPENMDWQARYLAQLPRIAERDIKIQEDSTTIASLNTALASEKEVARKGWAAADSLQRNNLDLINKGIKAALAINECRLGPLPCPSRKTVLLLTAAGAALLSHR